MIKAGIAGVTGYVGEELARILLQHPQADIKAITSKTYAEQNYNDIYSNFNGLFMASCQEENIAKMAKELDIIFLALPHGIASKKINKNILEKVKVIDLGADYRLCCQDTYEQWYNTEHFSPELLEEAVYGLSEIKREAVKNTRLVANPGCYTTCSILSLYPLLKEDLISKNSIIIDAKSGVSGAGRSLNLSTHYTECNESLKAYKISSHRHTPEIEQELSIAAGTDVSITFTPHLIPMNRGLLTTSYAVLNENLSYNDILEVYKKYYGKEFFVRILKEGIFPETRWVKGSNFFDLGFTIDERTGRIIIIGCIDNLVKGAAGQAVQNMNIMFGLDEKSGLSQVPLFPA